MVVVERRQDHDEEMTALMGLWENHHLIRWDLQRIDEIRKPSHLSLGVDGVLNPDRHEKESRLRGQLQIRMSFAHPLVLDFVPEDIRRNVALGPGGDIVDWVLCKQIAKELLSPNMRA
ncbi:hypothetical protein LguiA_018567 [Lonicera macranthoides]